MAGMWGNCGCHNVPTHQCPGTIGPNQVIQGINLECVECPIINTVLTTSQLVANGNLVAGDGRLHYNKQTNVFNYVDTQGNVQTLATAAQLAALAAQIPSAAAIAGMVNAALNSANILNLIDCIALRDKCGLITSGNIGGHIIAGGGIDITQSAGGTLTISLAGGGAGATTLTAAQIAYAFANVTCADLTAAVDRCNLCGGGATLFFATGECATGNIVVSGTALPATVRFEYINPQAGGAVQTYNIASVAGPTGTANELAMLPYDYLSAGTTWTDYARYSLDAGVTWSNWLLIDRCAGSLPGG